LWNQTANGVWCFGNSFTIISKDVCVVKTMYKPQIYDTRVPLHASFHEMEPLTDIGLETPPPEVVVETPHTNGFIPNGYYRKRPEKVKKKKKVTMSSVIVSPCV